jgi:hypothetical protein
MDACDSLGATTLPHGRRRGRCWSRSRWFSLGPIVLLVALAPSVALAGAAVAQATSRAGPPSVAAAGSRATVACPATEAMRPNTDPVVPVGGPLARPVAPASYPAAISDSPESIAAAITATSTPAKPKSSSIEPGGGRNLLAPADAIIAPAADPIAPAYNAIQVRRNSVAAVRERTGRVSRAAEAIGPARRLSTPISDSFIATPIASTVTIGDAFGWSRDPSQPSGRPRHRSDPANGRPGSTDRHRTHAPDVGYGVGGASAGSPDTAGRCAFAVLCGLFVIAAWGMRRLFSPTLCSSDSIAVNAPLERPG